ncbi:DNA primase [Paenibacillus medicaginis]|uniref:DNA primase n=1 Tax=Paenibacillus medicaginis TaxID=1470560 RepID=A0ABV5BXC3_9BACL
MSDSLRLLKERIYEEGTIGQLLEELGCDLIKVNHKRNGDPLVTARLPGSNNTRSVQIYLNPQLHTEIVNRGVSGDVYFLVGFILYDCRTFEDVKRNLYQIKTYICNALDYEHTSNDFIEKPKTDWNWWLRPIQKARTKEIEIRRNEIISESVLNQYINYPYYDWYNEGIELATQKLFGVGFDIDSERVTIPFHNAAGQLIGVKGRYIGGNKEISDSKKYSYLYSCSKSIELFNLHRALPYIKEKKECLVVEAAKTVMLLWSYGICNAVSIEGDKLSPVQAKLLKDLGLDIDFVFGWDKDKDQEYIKGQLKQIKNRRVYHLWDSENLFSDPKASPADAGKDIWLKMYNDRYKYKIC